MKTMNTAAPLGQANKSLTENQATPSAAKPRRADNQGLSATTPSYQQTLEARGKNPSKEFKKTQGAWKTKLLEPPSENNHIMINIICEELQNDKHFIDSFSHEHTLLITGDGDPVEITRGQVIHRPNISTSHEKTDIIIIQTFMAVEQGAECLSVMADDTDVYILLLHYYNQKELNIPMFTEDKL